MHHTPAVPPNDLIWDLVYFLNKIKNNIVEEDKRLYTQIQNNAFVLDEHNTVVLDALLPYVDFFF